MHLNATFVVIKTIVTFDIVHKNHIFILKRVVSVAVNNQLLMCVHEASQIDPSNQLIS